MSTKRFALSAKFAVKFSAEFAATNAARIAATAALVVLMAVMVLMMTACSAENGGSNGSAGEPAAEESAEGAEAGSAEGAEGAEAGSAGSGSGEAVVKDQTTGDGAVEGLPEYKLTGETDLPGNFFLSFVYSRNIVMLDGKGNIVWSKHEEQPDKDAHTGWWDFKKHVIDGKTYYSYHDQIWTYDNYGFLGYAPGERVILDEDFNEVKRIKFEKSDVVEKDAPLDGHDFLMIDLDHYILSGYIKDTVKNNPDYPDGSSVVYSYLQEVKDGEVVWDWKSVDYPELYKLTVTDGDPTANDFANKKTDVPDYIHFNAMRIDDDGDLICSFRNLSTILCLDRTKQDDQIKWKLSGKADEFGLAGDQKTSCQHYVTLDGEYISAFSNGNDKERTRLLAYKIDKEKKAAELVRMNYIQGKYSSACGSLQHISDELYTIGWGRTENDAECMSVYDFAAGKKLMSIELANKDNFTYRCVYYE